MAVTLRIGQFEGPLDLLLFMVGKEKIDIREIFVSRITDQYIQLIQDAPGLDMEEASDFIRMAATLLEIKTRSLLPRPPAEPQDDPEAALIQQLEEYASFKKIAGEMQSLEQAASLMHVKLPEEYPLPPPHLEITGLTLQGLVEAFARLLAGASGQEDAKTEDTARRIVLDEYTVPACMARILRRLRRGSVPFRALMNDHPAREEVVTLFLAMLELLRMGRAAVLQKSAFGEILLCPARVSGEQSP